MKTVVITGVTRGCGAALAERLMTLGHTVQGCGRSADRIVALQQRHPSPHGFAVVDVADDAAVMAWAAAVLNRCGPPDLLINNAAVINRSACLWEVPNTEFDQVVDVNIKGVANVVRHFVPPMIARGHGVVVNISSGWGRSTDANVAPYCATKWAIEGLTKAMAKELPAGMAAVPLNPGIIHTDMLRSCFGEAAGGYPSPEEWAVRAATVVLGLGAGDNGKSMSV